MNPEAARQGAVPSGQGSVQPLRSRENKRGRAATKGSGAVPASSSGDRNTWNHFDVVRVEKGMIKEHWDEARIAPPQPQGKQ